MSKLGATDADGDRSGSLRKRLAQIFGVDDLLFNYLFSDYGAWLMQPPELRLCMCELCLFEDFFKLSTPHHQKHVGL